MRKLFLIILIIASILLSCNNGNSTFDGDGLSENLITSPLQIQFIFLKGNGDNKPIHFTAICYGRKHQVIEKMLRGHFTISVVDTISTLDGCLVLPRDTKENACYKLVLYYDSIPSYKNRIDTSYIYFRYESFYKPYKIVYNGKEIKNLSQSSIYEPNNIIIRVEE